MDHITEWLICCINAYAKCKHKYASCVGRWPQGCAIIVYILITLKDWSVNWSQTTELKTFQRYVAYRAIEHPISSKHAPEMHTNDRLGTSSSTGGRQQSKGNRQLIDDMTHLSDMSAGRHRTHPPAGMRNPGSNMSRVDKELKWRTKRVCGKRGTSAEWQHNCYKTSVCVSSRIFCEVSLNDWPKNRLAAVFTILLPNLRFLFSHQFHSNRIWPWALGYISMCVYKRKRCQINRCFVSNNTS